MAFLYLHCLLLAIWPRFWGFSFILAAVLFVFCNWKFLVSSLTCRKICLKVSVFCFKLLFLAVDFYLFIHFPLPHTTWLSKQRIGLFTWTYIWTKKMANTIEYIEKYSIILSQYFCSLQCNCFYTKKKNAVYVQNSWR